ncbi:preprotein translocase subunit YajC [bacterium]|nr:preprotein translocase subunit YajC [bacterium]
MLPAYAAEGAAPPAPGILIQLLPFILIIFIFYFLLIRPQKKRQEEHRVMIDGLKKGDDVVTSGGMYAQVADVREDHFVVKIADNVRVKMTKSSIASKLSAGTEEKTS